MRQRKTYGQVFLNDETILEKIAEAVIGEGYEVVEIGAGDGRLSLHMLERTKHLYCLEVDKRFVSILNKKFSAHRSVTVINIDVLKFAFNDFNDKVIVCGNIPYHISKEITLRLIANRKSIKKACLTVQKEFADKLCASAATANYGYLSCLTQYYSRVNIEFDISASSFSPVPKVDSSLVTIDFYQSLPEEAKDEALLFRIIRTAFSQKRKKISNSLAYFINNCDILSEAGIPTDARAGEISLSQYISLSNRLYPTDPLV
jgi:16S rRNA (adenine1518-N6/adenine1519-N6)-dimethyltransferase